VGEFGILLDYDAIRGGWWVQFTEHEAIFAQNGLEVVNESK